MMMRSSSCPPWSLLPLLFRFICFTSLFCSMEASWQDPSAMTAAGTNNIGGPEALEYYTSYPIFAPGGRLLAIEKCMQEIQQGESNNNVAIAIHCRDGVVVVTTLTDSPYLVLPSSPSLRHPPPLRGESSQAETAETTITTTIPLALDLPDTGVPRPPFTRLSNYIWGVTAGKAVDSQLLRIKLQRIAEDLANEEGQEKEVDNDNDDEHHTIEASILARRVADTLQWPTQSLQRQNKDEVDEDATDVPMPLAACAFILTNREVWRLDPTGHFYKCRAAVVGRQALAVESHFLNAIQEKLANVANDAGATDYDKEGDRTSVDDDDNDVDGVSKQQHDSDVAVDKTQLHQHISNWTCEEALVAATRSIQSVLRRGTTPSHSIKERASSDGGGIRLQGMFLSKNSNHLEAQWYTDQELKELVVQEAEAKSPPSSGAAPSSSS